MSSRQAHPIKRPRSPATLSLLALLPAGLAVLGPALAQEGAGATEPGFCPAPPTRAPFGYTPGGVVIAAPAGTAPVGAGGPGGTAARTPGSLDPALDPVDAPVEASAARVTSADGVVALDGGARIDWAGRSVAAETARYAPDTGEVDVDGALLFEGPGVRLSSDGASIDLDGERFAAGATEYRIDVDGRRASGSAARMSGSPRGVFELEGATYSTCPPEALDWFVRADSIRLDTEAGVGTARGIALRFKGVPVFALPAFSFPVGTKRKTGFLAPAVARGDSTGFEVLLPWYWNIRPELDATFVPRLMTKRGVQLQSELRWLTPRGAWTLDNEVLKDRERDGEWRRFTRVRHAGTLGSRWRSEVEYATVSDDEYFEDLGNSLRRASITHLEQRAELVYEDPTSVAAVRVQAFETVDAELDAPAERPYRRLPQVAVRSEWPERPLGLRAAVDGELVYFDRSESVTGARADLRPALSLPLGGDAWFVEPGAAWRLTHYALDDGGPDELDSATRTLPTTSVDAGLFFDRPLGPGGSVQTLEPRLFYLRTPYRDQDELPVFDSSAFDFNFSQLFRENRYSGPDRVADANHLSLALTTRVIDGEDGRESLRASVGQILFFDDRRVLLPERESGAAGAGVPGGSAAPDSERSDLVAEIATRLRPEWIARAGIQWNPDTNRTVRGSASIGYRPGPGRILNFGHRVVSTNSSADTEQIDVSGTWPLAGLGADGWRLSARWNYSLDADVSLETLVGLEYDSCCWALRAAARRYISDDGEDHDNAFYLQLVLKGLAPVGQDYGTVLENAIVGYRDVY